MHSILTCLPVLFAAHSVAPQGGGVRDGASPPQLAADMAFFSSEELAGRIAGTEGCRRAASYIAVELEKAGLQGLGAEGGFLASYPAVRIEYPAPPKLLFQRKDGSIDEGVYGVDFNLVIHGRVHSTGELGIARVGKLEELPAEANADAALFLRGSNADRREWLAARGQGDGEGWGLDLRLAASEEQGKLRGKPASKVLYDEEEQGCETVYLRGRMRENLLWKGYTSVELVFEEQRSEVLESNVIAMLPGSDPELAREVVLLQSAYDGTTDRVSKREGKKGGRVRGSEDDASAAAVLLEIARRLGAAPARPRSVVFLFTTGTPKVRKGLGTFLEQPPLDLESVGRVLCLSGMGRPGREMGSPPFLWMTSMGTSLAATLEGAALAIQSPPRNLARALRGPAVPFSRAGLAVDCLMAPFPLQRTEATPNAIDLAYMGFAAATLEAVVAGLADGEIAMGAASPEPAQAR